MLTDIEIAQQAKLRPIAEIAKELSNINDKIEVEKQILLCLQKQKLHLLSQMFL